MRPDAQSIATLRALMVRRGLDDSGTYEELLTRLAADIAARNVKPSPRFRKPGLRPHDAAGSGSTWPPDASSRPDKRHHGGRRSV